MIPKYKIQKSPFVVPTEDGKLIEELPPAPCTNVTQLSDVS